MDYVITHYRDNIMSEYLFIIYLIYLPTYFLSIYHLFIDHLSVTNILSFLLA